ncbi:MAG: hypothetical protein ACTSXH_14360 [Promethearchaeota archaeon]
MKYEGITPNNNATERTLRSFVVQRKR